MKTGATRRGQRPGVADGWPQPPPDLELSIVWIDGEELAVLSHRLEASTPLAGLSEAEREVAAEVAEGLSNEQIARRRGTTSRTIAKQVASIFRKLGIGSRRQLFATMKRPAPAGGTPHH
jgi:DNA-binding CsgD family transcriptional regulator